MNWRIPFFDYSTLFTDHKAAYLQILSDVMEKGGFIHQKECRDFESEFAKFLGVKHAFGVSNCTDALSISLLAEGVKAGDEVILPSHSFVATADAVHCIGALPVLAECNRDFLIDVEHVKKLLSKKTRALIVVQLNGRIAEMELLLKLCQEAGIALIEDAAQAFGAKLGNRFAGTFGRMGAFSFYPAKVLGCFGDGGALVTDDDVLAKTIFLLRNHGCDPEGVIRRWGFNARLDNIQAAILGFKMQGIQEAITKRRLLASLYQKRLSRIFELSLPPPPLESDDHYDVFQNYEILALRRDELRQHLTEMRIGTLLPWNGKAIHQWESLAFAQSLPKTDEIFKKNLLLPLNPSLSEDCVDQVCNAIEAFYG